jgi:uncharacterized protein YjiS (DUF1127 family)
MSHTLPLPARTELQPSQLLARAWVMPPPVSTRQGAAAALRAALRRRWHAASTAWCHWRQIRATRLALANLDAATLRDIGIARSEIHSLAAEVHGGVEATRSRLLPRVRLGPF